MHLSFNDDTKTIVIDTPAGNRIAIDEQSKKIEIQDQNQNKITMDSFGIKLESPANIDIKAGSKPHAKWCNFINTKGPISIP